MGDGTLAYKNALERAANLTVNQSLAGADLAQKLDLARAGLSANSVAGYDGARLEQAAMDQALAPQVTGIVPATGGAAGGTAVTIIGKNFTSTTSANIGGTNLTAFAVVSDSKITGTSAAKGAGTYDVNVVGPLGTGTLTNGYVYT